MMKSLRGVSIALFALLTVVPACLAADETPAAAPADSSAAPPAAAPAAPAPAATARPAKPEPKFGIPGQASLGGGAGFSRFLADGDYTQARDGGGTGRDLFGTRDAAMRFAFAGKLRYTMSRHWRWQLSPGFLWTGYQRNSRAPFRTAYFPEDSLKDNYLALLMPVSLEIQFLHRGSNWLFHEGVGGGVYRLWIEQNRHVIKDPQSLRLHTGFYPGLTGEIGAEHFLKTLSAVSLEFTLASHLVFAERDEQFPLGYNSNVWTSELRFGANYYFTPNPPKKTTPIP